MRLARQNRSSGRLACWQRSVVMARAGIQPVPFLVADRCPGHGVIILVDRPSRHFACRPARNGVFRTVRRESPDRRRHEAVRNSLLSPGGSGLNTGICRVVLAGIGRQWGNLATSVGHSPARAAGSSSSATTVNVSELTSTEITGWASRLWYQVAGRPAAEAATTAKRPSPSGEAAQRRDALDPGLGADVVDEDHRGTRPFSARMPAGHGPLDDRGVVVARAGHDLLRASGVLVVAADPGRKPAPSSRPFGTRSRMG